MPARARGVLGAAALALALGTTPAVVAASASPMPMPPVPLPGLVVVGPATASALEVRVRCTGTDLVAPSSRCTVEASFALRALEPGVELEVPPATAALVTIDGARVGGTRALSEGVSVRVVLRFERSLSITVTEPDSPWILSPVRARHLIFGESPGLRRSGDGASGVLLDGVSLVVEGAIAVDATGRGPVEVDVGAEPVTARADVHAPRPSLSLGLSAPAPDDPIVQSGGPVLALGLRGTTMPGDEGRFALGIGYELALLEHVLFSIALESDLQSLAESLVAEIASPELAILIPSFAAGVGVVLRQAPGQVSQGALRIRVGANVAAAGLVADFDYWPSAGDWTLTAAARISI